jgi:hypothetical protein
MVAWSSTLLLVISTLLFAVLILILYMMNRIRVTLEAFLEEYRKEQEVMEKILLSSTADILDELKKQNQEEDADKQ